MALNYRHMSDRPRMHDRYRQRIETILEGTGVALDGPHPWDIRVNDPRFFARVLSQGTLGLGESYMDGWWDCAQLDEAITRLLRSDARAKLRPTPAVVFDALAARLGNLQTPSRAFEVGEKHYDAGNDLYAAMLDRRMTYTCGYWKDVPAERQGPAGLDEAQEAKLDLVCRKIGLKKGDRVLDIGCGWGSFAQFAAEKYGASVVGLTISKEQAALARERCAGLPVEVRLQDYRDVNETFDHIVSLGMFEHVGHKNYRAYFEVVRRCLKDGGLFLLHTIGGLRSVRTTDPWIDRYIFPNSMLPSAKQIAAASEGLFVMEDWHNFSADYDKTLMAWHANVDAAWSRLQTYDERFRRMWRYYLLACAGSFRSRKNQLWQIVFSKDGVPGGYASIR